MATSPTSKPTIGFIGLGEMGGPITRCLLRAGYPVIGFDIDARPARGRSLRRRSTPPSPSGRAVRRGDIVATSLPSSSSFVRVAEDDILPSVRRRPNRDRLRHGLRRRRRAASPPASRTAASTSSTCRVSGGGKGAERAQLYMFAGGRRAAFDAVRPLLEIVGGAERLTYCGPPGSGQVVKGVNQLMMGIVNAAYLEAIAFGVNEGVDAAVIGQAIGNEGRWRVDFNATAAQIEAGNGVHVGVKFRELPYFLHAAAEAGFDLPITAAVRAYCEKGERVTVDDHREAPSYWHELTSKG